MISNTELQLLKNALEHNNVENLIKKWEGEIYAASVNKSSNVEFTVKSPKSDIVKTIVGKQIADFYAFTKNPWGGSNYGLYHIESGVNILFGKKTQLAATIKEFIEWRGILELNEAIKNHGLQALRNLDDSLVQEYCRFYDKSLGRK